MKKSWLLLFVFLMLIMTIYYIPVSQVELHQLYPDSVFAELQLVRREPVKELKAGGHRWIYLSTGQGDTTLLFLHGMGGTYDIWFQQISYFKSRYRIISVEYPPAHSLKELAEGVMAVLDRENVKQAVVIGSSLGGYLAQYLAAYYSERVLKASLGNTFPPNTEIRKTTRTTAILMRILPEWLAINQMRRRYETEVLSASGNSPTVKAFLLSILGNRITKRNLLARYHCVIDYFDKPVPENIPLQIIESDNDPLITPALRQKIKEHYAKAKIITLHGEGHFPYLSNPKEYNSVLSDFIVQ